MIIIFTPTYNRVKLLEMLYSSLKRQKNKNFYWLIVDDGSTDDTQKMVKEWISVGEIKIIYHYQRNSGKHQAYNYAIANFFNKYWHMCVDSDDSLKEEAVSNFYQDMAYIKDMDDCLGMVYPREHLHGKNIWLPSDTEAVSIPEIKLKYKINSETAILFRPNALSFFPVFEGEKFLSEEIMYIDIEKKGRFLPKKKYLYKHEYHKDGLTHNLFRLWKSNPAGTNLLLEKRYMFIKNNLNGWNKIKEIIKCDLNIGAFKLSQKESIINIIRDSDNSLMMTSLVPLFIILHKKRYQ